MAAKSDGVLKMKKSDVAFTPLQNSEHSGSVQGLHPGAQLDSAGTGDADFANGESRCCGGGGSNSTCLRLGREQQKYTVWDCLWILAAVAVYVADVGSDVWLSVDYYLHNDYWWFGLTLFFVVLGSFSVQLFSFRWFVHDFSTEDGAVSAADCTHMDGNKLLSGSASHGDVTAQQHPATPQRQASTASKNTTTNSTASTAVGRSEKRSAYYTFCVWISQSIIHILQLGQIWRYIHTIYLGIQSHQSVETERWRYYWRMVYEFADVSMLHLLATFLESAPQLVLQLCIIIQTHKLQAVQGCRLFIYYLLILVENAALSALWYLYRSPLATDAFAVPALCVIFSSFFTGVVFMLMYYAFFHPNGPRFGRSLSGHGLNLDPTAQFSTLPSEVATNSLRSNRGATATLERDMGKYSERDGCMPVFQVRPTVPSTPSSRAPRPEETVIKIDLCRNRYPAWERHVLDRSIRKAILAVDSSQTPPRLQYKDDALVQERLEYETTL
ncbi:XK-related protein 4 [Takifugu rubripes]|uniref:XK-related protein n=1 Tax=Takifugu rubripes TaxID=31033 RepID=Q5GH51_TAKRU|nr:XK-related protein 4 [Takifugu rubripes]AAT07115.1 XK-related protein 4 [Takifugu rubripes]|eukprot:NP_001027886.1 XK-related protein 4 [Takifugu rubripes]